MNKAYETSARISLAGRLDSTSLFVSPFACLPRLDKLKLVYITNGIDISTEAANLRPRARLQVSETLSLVQQSSSSRATGDGQLGVRNGMRAAKEIYCQAREGRRVSRRAVSFSERLLSSASCSWSSRNLPRGLVGRSVGREERSCSL